jgi:hypothetical protein
VSGETQSSTFSHIDERIRMQEIHSNHLQSAILDLGHRLGAVELQLLDKAPSTSDSIPKHVLLDWLDEIVDRNYEKDGTYLRGVLAGLNSIRRRLNEYEA